METGINWQEVAAFLVILTGLIGFYTATHVRLNGHDIKIKALEDREEKTDTRFDKIMDKLESILLKLENKQDKHN